MARRKARPEDQHLSGHAAATSIRVSQNDTSSASPACEAEQHLLETLAEYFAILREWSLSDRASLEQSDNPTDQP